MLGTLHPSSSLLLFTECWNLEVHALLAPTGECVNFAAIHSKHGNNLGRLGFQKAAAADGQARKGGLPNKQACREERTLILLYEQAGYLV